MGNCVLANSKTLIRSLFLVLEQDLILSLANGSEKAANEKDKTEERDLVAQLQSDAWDLALREYKKFTKFIRDRVIDKILTELDNKENDESDRTTYVQLLEKFLSKDLSCSGKKEEELARRAKIIQFLEARKIPFAVTIKPKVAANVQLKNGFFNWLQTLTSSSIKISLNYDKSIAMSLVQPTPKVVACN